jgi:hypothetical protein
MASDSFVLVTQASPTPSEVYPPPAEDDAALQADASSYDGNSFSAVEDREY